MSVTSQCSEPAVPADPWQGKGPVPRLESGDRLTADEFMRRYEAMPDLKKAELIEGVVYVSSPSRHRFHGKQHSHLMTCLGYYEAGTPGVETSDNSTVCLDMDSVPQPDCLLFVRAESGGRVRINEEGYIVGALSWSRKSRPAASATTCTTNSGHTSGMASANISSGAYSTSRSTGSCCVMTDTRTSLPRLTARFAARAFPVSGSTRPRCCGATWRVSWRSSSRVSTPPSTPPSRTCSNEPEPRPGLTWRNLADATQRTGGKNHALVGQAFDRCQAERLTYVRSSHHVLADCHPFKNCVNFIKQFVPIGRRPSAFEPGPPP